MSRSAEAHDAWTSGFFRQVAMSRLRLELSIFRVSFSTYPGNLRYRLYARHNTAVTVNITMAK